MTKLERVLLGTVVDSAPDRTLRVRENWAIGLDTCGDITHCDAADSSVSTNLIQHASSSGVEIIRLPSSSFLLPGFIDTHLHAPQYLYAGTALDKPLMTWLEEYTFKAEARIDADPRGLGRRVYERLVQRLIEQGTTTVVAYGTLSVSANLVLAETCVEKGVRALIGKVNMDQNSPQSYTENTTDSLTRTREFIRGVEQLTSQQLPHFRLVQPVITPRFIPTCSEALLRGLREIAEEAGVRIMSHMNESNDSLEFTKKIWNGKEDIEVFQELGLLTSKTLMAHCTHLTDSQLSILGAHGTSISHCPLSNTYFSERPFLLREAWEADIAVGLGSDISGGYRIDLAESMRWAVGVSRAREGRRKDSLSSGTQTAPSLAITWHDAIYLATQGGAKAIGLHDRLGSFDIGKAFDAQLIRPGRGESRVDIFETTPLEDLVEKWWCNGDDRDRIGVWVQGRNLRWIVEE